MILQTECSNLVSISSKNRWEADNSAFSAPHCPDAPRLILFDDFAWDCESSRRSYQKIPARSLPAGEARACEPAGEDARKRTPRSEKGPTRKKEKRRTARL